MESKMRSFSIVLNDIFTPSKRAGSAKASSQQAERPQLSHGQAIANS
jgi:hypothetical protein